MRGFGLALGLMILACSPVGSGAADQSSASATATVTLTIEAWGVATWMKVTPRTLNPQSAKNKGNSGASDCRPMVKCRILVPDCLRGQGLSIDGDTLRLNDVPAAPAKDPPGPGNSYPLAHRHVHVFFGRAQVVDILGTPPGWRVLTFEGTITGGHSLAASDWVYLQPG